MNLINIKIIDGFYLAKYGSKQQIFASSGEGNTLDFMTKAWCPMGSRPHVAKQGVREYVYAYAAIAPKLGKMTALVLPYVNIEMMELLLKEVSSDFADYFILNAGRSSFFAYL